jgi:DNA repair protein RadC
MPSIKSLPFSHRPRERLFTEGAGALSLDELIMILLGTGTPRFSIEHTSQSISNLLLKEKGSGKLLAQVQGLGKAASARILAAIELGERLATKQEQSFTSPGVVASFCHALKNEHKEHLLCLYLDARYRLLHCETIAVGSLNQLLIYPRDIFRPIRHHAVAAMILVHNHPSGEPEPSEDDLLCTQKVKQAADIFGIDLLDHIILGKEKWYSLKEHGKMEADH